MKIHAYVLTDPLSHTGSGLAAALRVAGHPGMSRIEGRGFPVLAVVGAALTVDTLLHPLLSSAAAGRTKADPSV